MKVITRQEATQQGLSRYFTGKPCKYGHIASRCTANGNCNQCARESKTRKRYQAAYYQKNKQRLNEINKQWIKNNPEKFAEIQSKSSKKNIERRRAYARKHRAENPYLYSFYCRTRQAKQCNATPKWANHEAIKVKYKERNTMSKVTGLAYNVDHIIPLQGENVCGLHVANNLRVILARDNQRKSNRLEMPRSSTA